MKADRAERILQGQTGLAQKIFRAVPLQEYWTAVRISEEVARVEKTMRQPSHIVRGCLSALKDAGLVREDATGFQSLVKPETIKLPKDVEPMGQIDDKTAPVTPSLVDRLINEGQRLRNMADVLDGLAVEIDDEIQRASNKNGARLKQLQSTLRELMASEEA